MQRPRGERRTVEKHEVLAPARGVGRRLGAHHEANVAGAQRQGLEFIAHALAISVKGEDDHAEALAEAQFTDALADDLSVRGDGALEDDALAGRDLLQSGFRSEVESGHGPNARDVGGRQARIRRSPAESRVRVGSIFPQRRDENRQKWAV